MTFRGVDSADFRFGAAPWPTPGYPSYPTYDNPWVIEPGTVIQIPIEHSATRIGQSHATLTMVGDFSKCDTASRELLARTETNLSVGDTGSEETNGCVESTAMLVLKLNDRVPVLLDLYDPSGRHITRLADGVMESGNHRIEIPRAELAAGVYFYRLTAGAAVRSGRIVVVR
jgi:hypothetical protein